MTQPTHTSHESGSDQSHNRRSRRRLLVGGGLAALASGASVIGAGKAEAAGPTGAGSARLDVTVVKGTAIRGAATAPSAVQIGVLGTTLNGSGVQGTATGSGATGVGVRASGRTGVYSDGVNIGVYGSAASDSRGFAGVYGAGGGYGCYGYGSRAGVYGSSVDTGVVGFSNGVEGRGVMGAAYGRKAVGVHGENDGGGTGVLGESYFGIAVRAESHDGVGVHATSENIGVVATAHVGVDACGDGTRGSRGLRAEDGLDGTGTTAYAGVFVGRLAVFGTASASAGSFVIDHPLAPADRTLTHACVASPDMKTIYDGVAVLGTDGSAVVRLPAYVEALNGEFRYQLTCIGAAAPVFIAAELDGGRFTIAGGRAGLKVSWQVSGIRRDEYAATAPVLVEADKSTEDRGTYLNPAAFGKAATLAPTWQRGVDLPSTPRAAPRATGPVAPAPIPARPVTPSAR